MRRLLATLLAARGTAVCPRHGRIQVRPPALYAVSAALLMLGEVAEPPKAWRSLGPRLGKKDAQGNRLPWRGRLLRRLAAGDLSPEEEAAIRARLAEIAAERAALQAELALGLS